MKPTRVFLGLGSNIEPQAHLRSCCRHLNAAFRHIRYSSVYRSPAYGFEGADFLNMAAEIYTAFPPLALKRWLRTLENKHGRAPQQAKYADRKLDIDLLFYGQAIISNQELEIPRGEITQRDYVLQPLAELAPDWKHPQHNKKLSTLWRVFREQHPVQVQRIADSPTA